MGTVAILRSWYSYYWLGCKRKFMRAEVRHERRVGLAFEGLRWYAMKRWKIAKVKMNGKLYRAVRTGEQLIPTLKQ